jgi:arsenate reductase (thioredoxin)
MTDKPSVLFVCVHNAGRSQMAAGFLTHLAGDRIEVRSAGSTPASTVNPAAEAMREVGIDISAETPKILTVDAIKASDVCITMGCGDACPVFPGKRYLDWTLDDPAGQGVEVIHPIRDENRAARPCPDRRATPRTRRLRPRSDDSRERRTPVWERDVRVRPLLIPPATARGRRRFAAAWPYSPPGNSATATPSQPVGCPPCSKHNPHPSGVPAARQP